MRILPVTHPLWQKACSFADAQVEKVREVVSQPLQTLAWWGLQFTAGHLLVQVLYGNDLYPLATGNIVRKLALGHAINFFRLLQRKE